jgi:hypothetical protein
LLQDCVRHVCGARHAVRLQKQVQPTPCTLTLNPACSVVPNGPRMHLGCSR